LTVRNAHAPYLTLLAVLAAALLLRALLQPVLGQAYPLTTLYGAVAVAVWLCGWRQAVVVAVVGFVVANGLFVGPPGSLNFDGVREGTAFVVYLISCGAVIVCGEALRRRERRARRQSLVQQATLAALADAVVAVDTDGRIATFNAMAERLSGRAAAEVLGQPLQTLWPADESGDRRSVAWQPLLRVLEGADEATTDTPTVVVTHDGRRTPVEGRAAPIRDARGVIEGAVLVLRDISEQLRAEQTRRDGERGLRMALDAAHMVTWRYDSASDHVTLSDNASQVYGLSPGQEIASMAQRLSLLHPQDAAHHGAVVQQAIQRCQGYTSQFRVVRPVDRQLVWMEERAQCSRTADGGVELAGVVMDITARKLDTLRLAEQQSELAAELYLMTRLQILSTRLVRHGELDALLSEILSAAADMIGAGRGSMRIYDTETGALRMSVNQGLSERFRSHFAGHCWPAQCEEVARQGRRFVIEDIERFAADGAADDVAMIHGENIRALQCTPLLSRDGRLLGLLNHHFDAPRALTTRDQRCLDLLARMAADLIERSHSERALREADRRKDEFLATLAHELRNPLAPIRNAVELLERERTGNVKATAQMLKRQVRQLVRLVDDLLDLSRVTRGRIELRRQRVALTPIVTQAIEAAGTALRDMGHRMEVRMTREPLWLDADPARLAQVLGNVLNNATRYTDRGGHITLNAERDGLQVRITVRDNGIGIAADELSRIFEMFVQADGSHERASGGLGIGLTLARRLVQLHGGRIDAHSDGPGRGSEFIIHLPLAEGHALPMTTTNDPTPPAPAAAPRRILVVDDNDDGAQTLATLLQVLGYDAAVAQDGREAIELAERFSPHLVLLDLGLPLMDGHAVCRHIRAQPWSQGMAIVALTGWGQEQDRQRTRSAGFDDHLVKPAELEALTALFDRLWGAGNAAALRDGAGVAPP
jgi:PAS domain S-box-containing protein